MIAFCSMFEMSGTTRHELFAVGSHDRCCQCEKLKIWPALFTSYCARTGSVERSQRVSPVPGFP